MSERREPGTGASFTLRSMTSAYFSMIFDQPAAELWRTIRDFGNYSLWVHGAGTETMENGKTSDSVGAARVIELPDITIVQRLTSFSDADRAYRYVFEDGRPGEIDAYEATLSVTPITDGDKSFVQWSAEFECPVGRRDHWKRFYAKSFNGWLEHLRATL